MSDELLNNTRPDIDAKLTGAVFGAKADHCQSDPDGPVVKLGPGGDYTRTWPDTEPRAPDVCENCGLRKSDRKNYRWTGAECECGFNQPPTFTTPPRAIGVCRACGRPAPAPATPHRPKQVSALHARLLDIRNRARIHGSVEFDFILELVEALLAEEERKAVIRTNGGEG